jgi:hypothetical protein
MHKFFYIFFIFTPIFIFAEENQCQIFLDKYSNMDIGSLEQASKLKKSRLENKIYKDILDDKKDILKRSNVSFEAEIDDFSGDASYETSITPELNIVEGICKSNKKYTKGYVRSSSSTRGFMRKICRDTGCAPLQYYFVFRMYSDNAMQQYYGFNRAVMKGIGEVDFTPIDFDMDMNSSTYNLEKTAHIASNLTQHHQDKVHRLEESSLVKIYSNKGADIIKTLDINQINTFINGLKNNNAWID